MQCNTQQVNFRPVLFPVSALSIRPLAQLGKFLTDGLRSVLSASWVFHLCLFPLHHRPGSQVPYESPDKSHAAYTPDPAWPVSRSLPCCSQDRVEILVLVSSKPFRRFISGSFALISLIHT